MAKLNDADAIYAGAAVVSAVYLGGTEIWTPFAGGIIGFQGPAVDPGSYPPSDGRVVVDGPYTFPGGALVRIVQLMAPTGTNEGNMVGVVFSDTAGAPDELLGYTNAVATGAADTETIMDFAVPLALAGQDLWIGVVSAGLYALNYATDLGAGNLIRGEGFDPYTDTVFPTPNPTSERLVCYAEYE